MTKEQILEILDTPDDLPALEAIFAYLENRESEAKLFLAVGQRTPASDWTAAKNAVDRILKRAGR